VLGITGGIAHETLKLAVDVVDFVPVPGLAVAAKTLLIIWDTLQLVDVRCIISTYPRNKLLILSIDPVQPSRMPPPHREMCRYPPLCKTGN